MLVSEKIPNLRCNHLGNYSIMRESPNWYLLVTHIIMALIWVIGWLVQITIVERMGHALEKSEFKKYQNQKIFHRLIGRIIIIINVIGCCAGPIIAFLSHDHAPMRFFLMVILPLTFLPAFVKVWLTGKNSDMKSIVEHRFWTTAAIFGPVISSLWAPPLIWVFGHLTPIGPWAGELIGTLTGSILMILFVVIPAWLQYKKDLELIK